MEDLIEEVFAMRIKEALEQGAEEFERTKGLIASSQQGTQVRKSGG
jgi:hypothetical protein